MTLAQRPHESGSTHISANDHDTHEARLLGAASLTDEENIAALVRRTERRALLVIVGMGGWLMLAPIIYLVLTHRI
jgi:hypothetical protein